MNKVPVGIDLGTSNTVVYYKYNGRYSVHSFNAHSYLLPSVVEYRPTHMIGEPAVKNLTKNNTFVLKNTKRVLGVPYDNVNEKLRESLCNAPMMKAPDGSIHFVHHGRQMDETVDFDMTVTPVQVASDIIKYILDRVHQATELDLGKLTVTYPATYNEDQCNALKEAIEHSGVKREDFCIVNEPTAAAISHAIKCNFRNETILVYDLGGGTFDTTVLQIEDDRFRILAYDGDHNIGGVYFDSLIEKEILAIIQKRFHKSPFPPNDSPVTATKKARFIKQCEDIKIYLSTENMYPFSLSEFADELELDPDDPSASIRYFQSDITYCLQDILQKTLDIVDRTLKKANVTRDDISTVLFTGGSCNIKCIKELIDNYFGRKICSEATYAKESVGKGACIISDSWLQHPGEKTLQIGEKCIHFDDFTSSTLNYQTPIKSMNMVVRYSDDFLRLSNTVSELEMAEGACNEMEDDLVISGFDQLKSILVKKNAMKNLNSLKICDCAMLESFIVEDGGGREHSHETLYAPFENVKSVELTSKGIESSII